jgi:hypothetical protein
LAILAAELFTLKNGKIYFRAKEAKGCARAAEKRIDPNHASQEAMVRVVWKP